MHDDGNGRELKGIADIYLIAFFYGTACLTAAMRTVTPSSFGTDHQVTKPRSKVIMLDRCEPKVQWSLVNSCTPQGEPVLGTGGEKKYVHSEPNVKKNWFWNGSWTRVCLGALWCTVWDSE